jgi:transposase
MNEHDYKQRILELEKQVNKLENRNQFLEEQFRLAQQKQFGKSAEGHPGQGELFNEVEELQVTVEEDTQEIITYTRNKAKRSKISADIPRERVVHDINDAEKVCDTCAHELHCIGEDTSEKLEFIPAHH